jgi:drug/metabolite transporter (DMT)-like permease
MIYLVLTILLTSSLTLGFEILGRMKIPTLQAIVFNYFTCVITGLIVNGGHPFEEGPVSTDWVYWALVMGVFFIVLFNLIAFTTQHLGVAVTSVANKLSLVIPFLVTTIWYGEPATALKIGGVLTAILAVIFTCWPHKPIEGSSLRPEHGWILFTPIILFFGSGALDTMITFLERNVLDAGNRDDYFISVFGTAGLLGALVLIIRLALGKERFDKRSVVAGIAIGLPNYFSLWTLVQALSSFKGNSSTVFPVINIGIVLFSTLVAYFLFREKLSKLNWSGVLLSVLAIILMAWG